MKALPAVIKGILKSEGPIIKIRFEEPGQTSALVICLIFIILGLLSLFYSPYWLKEIFSFILTYSKTIPEDIEDPDTAAVKVGLILIGLGLLTIFYLLINTKDSPRSIKILRESIKVSYIIYWRFIPIKMINKILINDYSIEIFYKRNNDDPTCESISGHTGDLLGMRLGPLVGFLKSRGVEVVQRNG